jgi:membrane protein DedA with SNARE-associated domain
MATNDKVHIWTILPVCIAGVIIGDSCLYLIGRFFGAKLVEIDFVRKHLLTPERFGKIAENFQKYGVKILLFARLTPGIRAPIFLTAGITKLPITMFILADGIYAIPGVTLLFFLGYWSADTIIELIEAESRYVKPILVLICIGGVAAYFIYQFWKKPVVTGAPTEMPPIVGPVTEKLEDMAESMADRVLPRSMHPGSDDKKAEEAKKKAEEEAARKKAEEEADARKKAETEAAKNGQAHPPVEDNKPATPQGETTDGRQ